jgi:hypothetical protein
MADDYKGNGNGGTPRSGFTEEQRKRYDQLLSCQTSGKNVGNSMVPKNAFVSSPKEIYNGETLDTIMSDIELLRKGLETYIVETRGEDEGYRLVRKKRTEQREVAFKEPRTLGNLVKYVSERGVIDGAQEFIKGRTEKKMKPVEVTYEEKESLNITELREKLEAYVGAYLTQLNNYVVELGRMSGNIDNTIKSLTQKRKGYTEQATSSLEEGLFLKDQLSATNDAIKEVQQMKELTRKSDPSYVELKNVFFDLEDKISELQRAVSERKEDHLFSDNAERLIRAYEESLKNVKGVGDTFSKLIIKYVSFVDTLLDVSKSANGMVEKLAESFTVIQGGMSDVKKIASYTSQIYSKAMMTASALSENKMYVVEVEDMADNTTKFKEISKRKCQESENQLDILSRADRTLPPPASGAGAMANDSEEDPLEAEVKAAS